MSVCPACRWQNDADSGPCAGCGRDLAGEAAAAARPAGSVPVPEPRPYQYDAAPPAPVRQEPPPVVHSVSEPVPIRPQARQAMRTIEPSRDAPRSVEFPREPAPAEAPRRGPAPVRDIPVVLAPTASRAAVRFRDNEVDAGLPFTAPQQMPMGPATRLCPSCGTAVESTRRFCRCGARLPATSSADRAAAAVPAEGWTTSAFRRAQRAANGGRRARYDASLAARAYVVRAVVVLFLLLMVGSQAPPWGGQVRHWVQTRVEQALPGH